MSANPDSESQRVNATRRTSKIVKAVAEQMVPYNPEQEDAQALIDSLDLVIRAALEKAVLGGKNLPTAIGGNAPLNTVLNMQARHDLVVRLRAQGMHPTRIARQLGLSLNTVNAIISQYFKRKEQELRSQRMDEFILLMAEGYQEDMDRLSDVVNMSKNTSAVVGAIKARQEARQKYIDLLADFGFIVRKPTEVHVTGDGTQVDARTQNLIMVSDEQMKEITHRLLEEKRKEKDPNAPEGEEDNRMKNLVVSANDISA